MRRQYKGVLGIQTQNKGWVVDSQGIIENLQEDKDGEMIW